MAMASNTHYLLWGGNETMENRASNRRIRRTYGRVHGVVTRMYAHSFDVARDRDGMIVHALVPDRLATMAQGVGNGSVVDMHGLIVRDGNQCIMRVERLARFPPCPHRPVTAADLPHIPNIPDFTGGLGSVAYVRQLRGDE